MVVAGVMVIEFLFKPQYELAFSLLLFALQMLMSQLHHPRNNIRLLRKGNFIHPP